ncbi:MAG: HigA family addiction module antitoxin [Methyloceanibacter sp.]|uniref:HigA family addiction module antitoxin n=1 Tax=Methyloceanibacter sp. TaxID=1965321 RepID=UPI003EE1EB74
MTKLLAPVHPGEVLKEEFMEPLGLSANRLARVLRIPPNRISAIVNGERSVTADTALRLAKALGTTPDFWLSLQKQYDLDIARDAATDLGRIEPIRARAS